MSNLKKVDGRVTVGFFNNQRKPVRAIYCNVIETAKIPKNGKMIDTEKYDVTLILDADDIKGLKDKAIEVARLVWPGRDLKELKFPFKKSDEVAAKKKAKKQDADVSMYTPGTFVMSARSGFEVGLSWLDGTTVKDKLDKNDPLVKRKFYHGVWLAVTVNFAPFTGDDDDGITAYLDSVMWMKDGDRIGGRSGADAFRGYVGALSGEDPTAGKASDLSDEISF